MSLINEKINVKLKPLKWPFEFLHNRWFKHSDASEEITASFFRVAKTAKGNAGDIKNTNIFYHIFTCVAVQIKLI